MKKQVIIKVFGQVQGVFFRSETAEQAEQFGLFGWVRNEQDGSVKIIAEGEEKNLEKLIKFCKDGPKFAKVEKIEVEYKEASGGFNEFFIRYD